MDPGSPSNMGILSLPNELLLLVFEYAALPPSGTKSSSRDFRQWKYRTLAALSTVCHLFKHLATPILYEHLDISIQPRPYGPSLPLGATILLHRTLSETPSLRQHCQRFFLITCWQSDMAAMPIVRDFANWLTGTVSLTLCLLHVDAEENDLTLGAVVQHMPRLESLTIQQGKNGIPIGRVRHQLCQLPHLREVSYDTGMAVDASLSSLDVSHDPAPI